MNLLKVLQYISQYTMLCVKILSSKTSFTLGHTKKVKLLKKSKSNTVHTN